MNEEKKKKQENSQERVRAGDWVFFIFKDKLYKSRQNGSELTPIGNSSGCTSVYLNKNMVCFDMTEEHSKFDEEHGEYNRYRDTVTYGLEPDGKEAKRINTSHGYLGTSN